MGAVDGGEVGVKKAAQMLADLLGDDVFLQLLPDAGGIHLVGLDDAVDGTVNRLEEKRSDVHVLLGLCFGKNVWITSRLPGLSALSGRFGHQAECAVVVVFSKRVEEAQRMPVVTTWKKHQ